MGLETPTCAEYAGRSPLCRLAVFAAASAAISVFGEIARVDSELRSHSYQSCGALPRSGYPYVGVAIETTSDGRNIVPSAGTSFRAYVSFLLLSC